MSMSNESRERHVKQFEMQFMSRDSSSKHMQMQEGLLEETFRKQSAKLVSSKSSSKKNNGQFNKPAETTTTDDDQVFRKKFLFSFKAFIIELLIAYGVTIGICYLIIAGNFPYFEMFFILGLMASITPWTTSNLLLVTAMIITLSNHFLNVTILTYPAIIICYLSTLIFNEEYKVKIIFILVLVLQLAFGFALLPGLYNSFPDQSKTTFYYVFPIFMFLLRMMVALLYWMIQHTSIIFLQIPLFIMGLEYGVICTLETGYIEYWYLMVFFTLQIINQRTQFTLRLLVSMINRCRQSSRERRSEENNLSVLPAHYSGYSSINSLHIVCVIYIFTTLPLYSSPYTQDTVLSAYISKQWYIPLTTWALVCVYEIMCLVLERKRKDRLLIGFVDNGIPQIILRGLMLVLGFWMFYLGLGIGNYMFFPNNIRTTT